MEEARSRKGTKIDVSTAAKGPSSYKTRKGRRSRQVCLSVLGPGLKLPLVILCDEPLNVRQLAVQVFAASLLTAVVGVGLFDFPVFLKNLPTGCLVLIRALAQLSELCIKLGEPAGDLLDPRVQTAVLAVLSIEVILVALTLL